MLNKHLCRSSASYSKAFRAIAAHLSTAKRLNQAEELLSRNDAFVFDCDGVIWRGDHLIPKVPLVLEKLRKAGKKIFFVTNNSAKSRKGFQEKFMSFGLQVHQHEILSSSYAAAVYLQQNPLPLNKKVYVIGNKGVTDELELMNISYLGGEADNGKQIKLGSGVKVDHDKDVGAVIVGFDLAINYYKIQYAQLCINENPGCLFIATNLDAVAHLTNDQEWAENGAIVGAIQGCTNQTPIVVGKPSSLLMNYIADKYHISKSRMCMIGDRLDTDVLFGKNNGLTTVLTLSGVTTERQLFHSDNKIIPDYYVDSVAEFLL